MFLEDRLLEIARRKSDVDFSEVEECNLQEKIFDYYNGLIAELWQTSIHDLQLLGKNCKKDLEIVVANTKRVYNTWKRVYEILEKEGEGREILVHPDKIFKTTFIKLDNKLSDEAQRMFQEVSKRVWNCV